MAKVLSEKRAEQEGDPELAYLGNHWVSQFLDRHPEISVKFSAQFDRQRSLANNVANIRDYYLHKHNIKPENMYSTILTKKVSSSAIRQKQKQSVERDDVIQKLYRMEHVRCSLLWNVVLQESLCFPPS